jgi:hypothetical protein
MCPCGLVRSGDFRNGTPMTAGHEFGTPVSSPAQEPFGNVEPQSNVTLDSNPVAWLISPAYFGNTVDFSLQSVPPIILIEQGDTGSVNINLTNLLGTNSAALTFTGAPVGVSITFSPNPDTGTSVAEISVGATVPVGKYTIEIDGTGTTETDHTNIHLVVVGVDIGGNAFGFELEDGTGVILLESGSILLLENQA